MTVESRRSGRLQIETTRAESGLVLVLSGKIDEGSGLAELAGSIAEPVTVDLQRVEFINSMGARDWVRLMRALNERSIPITLRRCSEVMVYQMNMIVEARSGAKVESIYAPYECAKCGFETYVLLDATPRLRREQPTHECEECGAAMSFADLPASYFLFLEADGRMS
jgi:anti-anti-sigma regulatory factor/DNA-directed RNA polymerase subunit RPC12/RpoP